MESQSGARRDFLPAFTLMLLLLWCPAARAANPSSGTVSGSSLQASWTGGPMTPTLGSCDSPSNAGCDHYRLTITPPPFPFNVEINLTPQLPSDDYDLEVYGPNGEQLDTSGNIPGTAEQVVLANPPAGVYTVTVAPYASLGSYRASARIVEVEAAAGSTPRSSETPPGYANYNPPAGLGANAGEPTLGVNERTGEVMYVAYTETLRVSFDECTSPATAKWTDESFLTTSQTTLDPILFTDQELGRTFVSQLLFPSKQSAMAFTDNDGLTWTPSQGSGISSGVDHQTVGGGPFAPGPLGPLTDYPHAVYYCGQDTALANCAVSRDGGLTFGPAMPIYTLAECNGLHGHIKVGPEGTAYVPNPNCQGEQGVAVSTDNGTTWTVRRIPGSIAGGSDPSVAVASDGTLYMGWADGDRHPFVAVSHDQGRTWTNIHNVGTTSVGLPYDIQNVAFPAMVAGDGDRATLAFLGTSTPGNGGGDDPTFPAEWHLYIAHTYDGGRSWVTVDATPNDPVQRGTICQGGIGCSYTRNLLDFNDATLDAEGRVLVSYADGCTGSCVRGLKNGFDELATIARQRSGKSLYAAYDGQTQTGPPATPLAQGTRDGRTVRLTWSTPDDHGSPITAYRVYRRPAGGSWTRLGQHYPTTHSYTDNYATEGTTWHYRVTAVNARGESPACTDVAPTAPEPVSNADETCVPPGKQVATDAGNDAPTAALEIESLSIAEPSTDGSPQLVFTLKVKDLQTIVPGNSWMILWNRPLPDATHDRNYVVMRATGFGTADFFYGRLSSSAVGAQVPNQATDLGPADAGAFSTDGTITLAVSVDKVDGVVAGQDLKALEVRAFAANVSGMTSGQQTAADYLTVGTYTLAGTAVCANRSPRAGDDSAAVRRNGFTPISVLANDTDPDGDPLTIVKLGAASNGKVVAKKSGDVTYKPNPDFTGIDTFTYTVSDGHGHTDTATVTVTVRP